MPPPGCLEFCPVIFVLPAYITVKSSLCQGTCAYKRGMLVCSEQKQSMFFWLAPHNPIPITMAGGGGEQKVLPDQIRLPTGNLSPALT